MKKSISKQIHEISEALGPKGFTYCYVPVKMSGTDALLSGYGKYPRKQEFLPDEIYEFDTPVLVAISWEKELKKAYQTSGMDGIMKIVQSEHKKRVLDTGLIHEMD